MTVQHRFSTFLFIFLSVCLTTAAGDDTILPQEEDASSFYSIDIDDEDVDLFLSGTWQVELSGSTGFGWVPGTGFTDTYSYSGISEGFTFSQSPDFTISLLILDKLLFESAFTDEFEDSTFRLGYIGDDDEFVKEVSAGNMEINLSDDADSSDFFYIPGGDSDSYGVYSLFEGLWSEHELLFRFDPQEEISKLYIGDDLLVEIEREPSDYLDGRLFYIPDTPSDAVFYVESSDGSLEYDSRHFEEFDSSDYSYNASTGRLLLEDEPDGAVLVYSDLTGWDDDILLLWEPGIFSDYEAASLYDLSTVLPDEDWQTRVYLAETAETASEGLELEAEIFADDGLVIIGQASGGSKYYPLEAVLAESEDVYGANASDCDHGCSKSLFFRVRETVSSYSIDDPVEDSIRIYINGVETWDWSESGGIITFETDPGDNDRIEIIYRKVTGSDGGDLLFASANRFTLTDSLSANINSGIRWNISDSYAVPGEETSAYGGISAGLSFDSTGDTPDSPLSIAADLDIGAKILVENSAGRLLLKNGTDNLLEVSIDSDNIFPASLSDSIADDESLSLEDRGQLVYREYRIDSGLSYYLQDYSTVLDDSMIFYPEDSTTEDMYNAGPYTASATTDDRSTDILIMDYVLPDEDSWVGVQIPLAAYEDNLDLSSARAISFDCKTDADLSDIELYLEIGSVGEDLDGDGTIDEEASLTSTGYTFNDPNSPDGTLVGGDYLSGGNGQIDSEDINGNGFLDVDKTSAIVRFSNITKPDQDWQRFCYYFSDDSGDTAKSRLNNAEFIRITAVNTAASDRRGRILFDDFTIEGSSFAASDDAGFSSPEFSDTLEADISSSEEPESSLSSPTLTSDDDNSLMRVEWTEDWKLYSYITPVSSEDYAELTFFYHCPELTESSGEEAFLNFIFTDSDDLGIKLRLPLETGTDWKMVEVSLPVGGSTAAITVNGETVDGAELIFDEEATDLYRMELYTQGTDSGVILIDEIYLGDPVLKAVSGINESFELSYKKPLLTAGEIEIIGPLYLNQSASLVYEDYAENIFSNNAECSFTTDASTSFLGAPIAVDLSVSGSDNVEITAGHCLEIPVPAAGFSLTDEYSLSDSDDNSFYKSNTLSFGSDTFLVDAGFSSSVDDTQLQRSWNAGLRTEYKIFDLDIGADFLLAEQDYDIGTSNYFAGWYTATALAGNFGYTELEERKTGFTLSSAVSGENAGINMDCNLTADTGADSDADDSLSAVFLLPFTFKAGYDSIKAELSYERTASFGQPTASTAFTTDISRMFTSFASADFLYKSIPFYELFSPDLPLYVYNSSLAAGFNTAEFINEVSISLSRNYSSRLMDLLLPYSVEITVIRETEKDYSDTEDTTQWSGIWRSAALNLFGSAGVYPVFDFYFSDELNWSVETEIYEPFTSDFYMDLIIDLGLSLFGHDDDILSVGTDIYLPFQIEDTTSSVTSELMYVWSTVPEKPLNLPLFTDEEESFQIITNEEKLTLNFEDTFSTELKHTTSLQLPGTFTLSAYGLAGYEFDNTDNEKVSTFGLSFGISGSIIY
ncbi:MAG: hypothetical protein PQJ61_01980 [Spirochaetales bacterium]|uniref:Uncharacterized protein n=1 Tax=Candidatus Thalassospirochaeta sargassi TaxID=3119039 RepID=A0AAJ1ML89_9SPIO|nr:hypothetical protein [Spirochaetales bacterium]